MLGIKAALERAQQVKTYLVAHGLLDRTHSLARAEGAIIFPVVREFSAPFDFDVEFVDIELDEREQGQSLREAMSGALSEDEMRDLIAAYDIVGSIAILEIPPSLEAKEALIGETVMRINTAIRTVLKKTGVHEGEYRTQRMACIAGEDTRESVVIENGVRLKVNVEEAYYSVRMASERKRIIALVRPGERILCLFSGVGPYPVALSRHTQASRITGVEINPKAHELALENAALNRCTNVSLLLGDALEVVPRLAQDGQAFDRITMPLPHTAHEFLDAAISVSARGATIHYYSFQREGELGRALDAVRDAVRRGGRELVAHRTVKAGQHAPRVWRVCVDAQVR